ncbi:MAG: hypothetical protein ACQEQJ_01765 [Halobacteriota archaeon]
MVFGEDETDRLAHALVEAKFGFDAVEQGPYRAVWGPDNTFIEVTNTESGEKIRYLADDLVVATSDREVRNARKSDQP